MSHEKVDKVILHVRGNCRPFKLYELLSDLPICRLGCGSLESRNKVNLAYYPLNYRLIPSDSRSVCYFTFHTEQSAWAVSLCTPSLQTYETALREFGSKIPPGLTILLRTFYFPKLHPLDASSSSLGPIGQMISLKIDKDKSLNLLLINIRTVRSLGYYLTFTISLNGQCTVSQKYFSLFLEVIAKNKTLRLNKAGSSSKHLEPNWKTGFHADSGQYYIIYKLYYYFPHKG